MQRYEVFYFTQITLDAASITNIKKQVSAIVAKNKGNLIREEEIGKKKLAYTIKHTRHGYFMLTVFEAPRDKVSTIKKELKLIPEIIRYRLVVEKKPDIVNLEKIESYDKKFADEKKDAQQTAKTKNIKKTETADGKKKFDGKVDLNELDLKIDELLSNDGNNL